MGLICRGHLQFPLLRHFSPIHSFALAFLQLFLPLSFPLIVLFLSPPSFQHSLGQLQISIHFNHHRPRFPSFKAVQPFLFCLLPFPLEFSQQLRQRLLLQPFQSAQSLFLHRAFLRALLQPLRRHLIFLWLQVIHLSLQSLFLLGLPTSLLLLTLALQLHFLP